MTDTLALAPQRDIVFLSKATPGDDEFVLWLAPRLEAAGYVVFADILSLEAGDRWRKVITATLQDRAAKMLLCGSDSTLARDNVQEEVGIALDLAKSLPDPRFLLPLRVSPYKKVLGIGELQYVDFVRGWGEGLEKLLEMLARQKVPTRAGPTQINPNWEKYRRRKAITVRDEPERLTSNWLRVASSPDNLRLFRPLGAFDRRALALVADTAPFPVHAVEQGILTFADVEAVDAAFLNVSRMELEREISLSSFVADGLDHLALKSRDASNIVHSMFRQSWNSFCRDRGLLEYSYSAAQGFHVGGDQLKLGSRVSYGKQGEKRSAVLRNVARGHVWQYGVSSVPSLWPFAHYKLKSRVLFAPPLVNEAGEAYDDTKKQHRLRRSVCKGWRNRQWYGRLLAFLELLSGGGAFVKLPLGGNEYLVLESSPMLFTSPVSTALPNTMDDDDEDEDLSTLGWPERDEDDD